MKIRLANQEDLPALSELFFELIHHFSPGSTMNLEGASKYVKRHLDRKGDYVFAALKENELIGTAVIRTLSRTSAIIRDAYVKPAFRQKGVMRALEGEAVNFLKEKGIKKMELVVDAHDNVAKSTWRALGFKPYTERMTKRIDK